MPLFDDAALREAIRAKLLTDRQDPAVVAAAPAEHKSGIGVGPYAAMIGGNLADAVSTGVALRRPDVAEANPLGAGAVGIAAKAGGTALMAYLMHKLADQGHPTAAKILGYGIGAGTGAMAIRNSQVGKE